VAPAALPRRHRGLDDAWRAELRSRADVVVVTHADGDRGGPLRADAALSARRPARRPPTPHREPLEAGEAPRRSWPLRRDRARRRRVGGDAAARPGVRLPAWAAPLVDDDPRAPWPARAPGADRRGAGGASARARSGRRLPALAPWLERHAAALARLRFGVRLEGEGTAARLDAVERGGASVRLVRFTLPDEDPPSTRCPDRRWTELWAADLLRAATRRRRPASRSSPGRSAARRGC
jgi:hypothetical protein